MNYHHAITSLTTGIEKNELQDDVWLRRGSGYGGLASLIDGGSGIGYDDALRILQRGTQAEKDALRTQVLNKSLIEHSFLSTGIADDAGFQSNLTRPVEYTIYAPKGTKAVYAEPQSFYGGTIGKNERIYETGHRWSGVVDSEAEVTIQRGSRYKIRDIRYSGSKIEVDMDVFEQPSYFKYGDEDTYNDGATRHKR